MRCYTRGSLKLNEIQPVCCRRPRQWNGPVCCQPEIEVSAGKRYNCTCTRATAEQPPFLPKFLRLLDGDRVNSRQLPVRTIERKSCQGYSRPGMNSTCLSCSFRPSLSMNFLSRVLSRVLDEINMQSRVRGRLDDSRSRHVKFARAVSAS